MLVKKTYTNCNEGKACKIQMKYSTVSFIKTYLFSRRM